MDFNKVIQNRYSVRDFANIPVEDQKIQNILEVFRTAPTAKNQQPVRVYVVKDSDMLQKIDSVSKCRFGARLVFMVCSDKGEAWVDRTTNHNRGEMDASIAATHIMLSAVNEGLGTCWVCLFDGQKARELFELPENVVPECFIMAGYPGENAVPSERHTLRHELKDTVKII